MCLAAFAVGVCDAFPLVVAANRDESHRRPTAAADWWAEPAGILGGRDLEAGGSWLAVDRRGRLAAVTNQPSARVRPGRRAPAGSRGHLVRDYLAPPQGAETFCEALAGSPADYGPYNLLMFDGAALFHAAIRSGARRLEAGIHALSNAPLGTPWPKTEFAASRLAEILDAAPRQDELIRRLFGLLETRDPQRAGGGSGPHWRARAVFVTDARYGTRSSTVVLMSKAGDLLFVERRYGADGSRQGESAFRFSPASADGPPASR